MKYLASPYTSKSFITRMQRYEAACKYAAMLMGQGVQVFSPIAHTHPIAEAGKLPRDWKFWATFDEWFISRCDELIVLKLPGWEESKGVQAEIKLAKKYQVPVRYVEP